MYYGVRKRPEENAAELPRYHQLIEQADTILHAVVSKPEARLADFPPPSLPPLPEGKSIPDRFSGGVLKAPAQQEHDLTVADGYTLNLFASEEQFPELKNPVQFSFDVRGRLWVVTMPSFPHTVPGEQPHDKILILEDTDRDGRADKCTVFADAFDALDGVASHEKGVIVSAQPRLLILQDTDGDGRADTQTDRSWSVRSRSLNGRMAANFGTAPSWPCAMTRSRAPSSVKPEHAGTMEKPVLTSESVNPSGCRCFIEFPSPPRAP